MSGSDWTSSTPQVEATTRVSRFDAAAPAAGESELERTVVYVEHLIRRHRKRLVWFSITALGLWALLAVKEVTSLLLLAYVVAVLLDPLLVRMNRFGVSRGVSIALMGTFSLIGIIVFLALAVPVMVQQYADLVAALPTYLRSVVEFGDAAYVRWTGEHLPVSADQLWAWLSHYTSMLGVEHLRRAAETLSATLLSGYSITLTILNLVLFPLFLYYLASDLPRFHAAAMRLLPLNWRAPVRETGGEILVHLHAFVRGQLTVSSILTLFYICGLLIIGLPSAFVIGFLSGALSVVPYLGVVTGLTLSVLVTLMSNPGWWPLLQVGIVYAVVQTLEGSVLTPRIVGESLGLHPLLVMLALVVASQLLGLLGLVIAIPLAATIRVLLKNLLKSLEHEAPEGSPIIVASE